MLESLYVSKEKSTLSLVKKELIAADVFNAFGQSVKFNVSMDEPSVHSSVDVTYWQ